MDAHTFLKQFWTHDGKYFPDVLSANIGYRSLTDDGKERWKAGHWYPDHRVGGNKYWSPMLQERYGPPRNTIANAHYIGGFIADDIGTKATLVDGLTPFAMIETSPGNWQAVYALDKLLNMNDPDDKAAVTAVLSMLKDGKFSDASGNNPVRWGRLPSKYPPEGKEHAAKITEFTGHRHSIEQIIAALEFSVTPTQMLKAWRMAFGESTLTGTTEELAQKDPTFAWLKANKWVIGLSGSGPWWRVRCPLGHEHSDGKPECGCRYLPDAELGGWVCDRGADEANNGHVAQRALILGKPASQVFREALEFHGGPEAPVWRMPVMPLGDHIARSVLS